MSGPARQNLQADLPAYENSWEYLSDELQRLDLRLRQEVLKQSHARPSDPLSPFKGLVITDAEVSDLLAYPQSVTSEQTAGIAEQQKLERALADFQNEIE